MKVPEPRNRLWQLDMPTDQPPWWSRIGGTRPLVVSSASDPDAPVAPLAALEAAIERDDTDATWAALAALGVGERRPPDQPLPRRRTHEPPGLLWTDPRTHRVVRAAAVADPEDAPWPPLEGARP